MATIARAVSGAAAAAGVLGEQGARIEQRDIPQPRSSFLLYFGRLLEDGHWPLTIDLESSRWPAACRSILLGDEHGEVPDDPFAQPGGAIGAVFSSWNSARAIAYRKHHGLSELGGTAVAVQAMVFGNMDSKSGTGVLFSRNPMTGKDEPFGEWLPCGQGEDVVSGTFDVEPVSCASGRTALRVRRTYGSRGEIGADRHRYPRH
jgi:hypothetical protein